MLLGNRQPIVLPSGLVCVELGRLWEPGASQGSIRSLLAPSCEDRVSCLLGDVGDSPSVPSALSLAVLLMVKLQVPEFIYAREAAPSWPLGLALALPSQMCS